MFFISFSLNERMLRIILSKKKKLNKANWQKSYSFPYVLKSFLYMHWNMYICIHTKKRVLIQYARATINTLEGYEQNVCIKCFAVYISTFLFLLHAHFFYRLCAFLKLVAVYFIKCLPSDVHVNIFCGRHREGRTNMLRCLFHCSLLIDMLMSHKRKGEEILTKRIIERSSIEMHEEKKIDTEMSQIIELKFFLHIAQDTSARLRSFKIRYKL